MPTEAQAKKKVLDLLRAHLGTGETPPGSNHNFITVWYNNNVAHIGDGPWCQMTDTWSVWQAGFKVIMKGEAYTVYAAQNAQKGVAGASWHYGTKGMKAGDQVYYDWDKNKGPNAVNKIDHTGTVEKILPGGLFYALEGNIGDKLQRVKRDGTYVVGYVRLDWSKVSTPAHAPAKPKPTSSHQSHPTHPSKPAHPAQASHPKQDPKVTAEIEQLQKAVGLTGHDVDGKLGDKTKHAVDAFVKEHYNKF